MTVARKVTLNGPVVELSQYRGNRLEFHEGPLWELVEAVAERMGVDTRWENADDLRRVTAELERIQQAILNAAEGVVEDLIDGLRRYAETGEENDSVRYMLDCLRIVRQREETAA